MSNLFESKQLNEHGIIKTIEVRQAFKRLKLELFTLVSLNRERDIMENKLEEACFYAIKSVSTQLENQVTQQND